MGRRGEIGADALHVLGRQGEALRPLGELGLDRFAHRLGALLVDEDLDPGLVLVVAPPFEIVDAHDRVDIGEEVGLGQELADLETDHRRATEAAPDIDPEAQRARRVLDDLQADVMRLDHGAVALGPGHGDLELPRQEGILGVQRRPLPQDLGIGARIRDLVGSGAGEMVGGDVADAIARGLDCMHLDGGERVEDVGAVLQRRPVELDVLPRREMPVAPVVPPRDMGEHAHLLRAQRTVGDRHAQHVGMQLQVHAVHQAVQLELVFREFARQATRGLVAELGDALGHEPRVELVIPIHGRPPAPGPGPSRVW